LKLQRLRRLGFKQFDTFLCCQTEKISV